MMPPSSFAGRFPDPSARAATSRHRTRRRAAFVCALAAVIVAGLLVTSAFGSSGPDYRTAAVTRRAVDATLNRVGTIEPVSQATVAFPVAGTVASVSVKPGDSVDVGTALASLDGTSLTDTLHQKQAALAQAQLTLSKALAGQSVGSPSASLGGNGGGGSGGNGSTSGGSGATGGNATVQSLRSGSASRIVLAAATVSTDPKIAAAQQAVLTAQQQVDAALTAAQTALTTAQTVCASATSTTSTSSATTTGSPSATSSPDDLTACQKALQDVLTADSTLADAQHGLVDASNALDDILSQQAATPPPSPAPSTPSTPPSNGSPTGSSGSGGSSRGSGGASSGFGSTGTGGSGATGRSSSPSAADLAAFQQNVDAATAAVAVAQQALAQATITSPIAGKVVAVNMRPGDNASAASTTENVVIQGPGGFEVSTTVGVDQVAHVAVGQRASVVPDGTHRALAGTVTSVAVAPDSSSNTYLVVIGLTNPNTKLNNGATGSVGIVTQSAKSALAVPTSAVTATGARHTVLVADGDSTRRVTVRVGAVGTTWTEITSGLHPGDLVVIADVSAPLPGSATASTNGTNGATNRTFTGFPGFGGRGGFGGAGR
jgi:HlyD family secretion protein